MKKILLSFLVLSSAVVFNSCSEDFKVAAPYKDVTIIYGLLDMRDTAHYIRIQKAFLDENKSAIDMSKIADSNFYKDLDVKVREISGASVLNTTSLTRVNMETEGFPKDTGAFFASPNYAYKFKRQLNPAYKYRLVVLNPATGDIDSSEINILDTSDLKVSWRPNFIFANTVPASTALYQMFANPTANVKYLEGIVRFHWLDSNLVTGTQTPDSADYLFDSKAPDGKPLQAAHASVYTFLKDAMGVPPTNSVRLMDSVDFFIYGGGVDFYNYIVTTQLQSGGLTSGQIKPLYTNIKGKDVYGIFSTRTFVSKFNIPIDDITIDSLKVNPITKSMEIRGRAHQ
jgi:hypothetical protein